MRWYGIVWVALLVFLSPNFFSAGLPTGYATTTTATSADATFSIVAYVPVPEDDDPPSGGGGGGSVPIPTPTEVSFSGFAYPSATVTFLKDAQYLGETTARVDTVFDYVATGLSGGTYLFSLSGEDVYGNDSRALTYSVSVISGARTTLSGIVMPATVSLDKIEVKKGDTITIFGQTLPNATVTVTIAGYGTTTVSTMSTGLYEYVLSTASVPLGTYGVSVTAQTASAQTPVSAVVSFTVGDENIENEDGGLIGDVNYDDRVNIADFSIAAFWYHRPLSSAFMVIEDDRLNGDGAVTLIDFSLMAYYWTG